MSYPNRNRTMAPAIKFLICTLALVVVAIIAWWTLGYQADNCHDDDMSRFQQLKCNIISD